MVIGIEIQRLFRAKKHGMEIVALEIIRQIQNSDLNNQYIIFSKNDVDTNCLIETINCSIKKISSSIFPIWEQFYLPRAVKKSNPDLLHCTSNTAPLICKIPLIITIHDVIYMESISFSGSPYQNFGNLYRRFIVPFVAKKAKIIITVSEFEKKVISKRLGISESKIRVVYNGVNEQFRQITDKDSLRDFSTKYKLPEKFLLHFGNTAPKKNTIGVLKAYKLYFTSSLNPLQLVITDCSTEYIALLLKQIDAVYLKNNIQILDYIPFNTIPYLYNLSTIFLYPSLRESFGMPVIEAMACGIPVITSNTSALPEIAGGAACLVNPNNYFEINEQINRLLDDKEFYKNKQSNGFNNAAQFSWQNAANKTLLIYRETLNEKSIKN